MTSNCDHDRSQKADFDAIRFYAGRHVKHPCSIREDDLGQVRTMGVTGAVFLLIAIVVWAVIERPLLPVAASILALTFLGLALYLFLMAEKDPEVTWRSKFLSALHDYTPCDQEAYDRFVTKVVGHSATHQDECDWLSHEGDRVASRMTRREEEVLDQLREKVTISKGEMSS